MFLNMKKTKTRNINYKTNKDKKPCKMSYFQLVQESWFMSFMIEILLLREFCGCKQLT